MSCEMGDSDECFLCSYSEICPDSPYYIGDEEDC